MSSLYDSDDEGERQTVAFRELIRSTSSGDEDNASLVSLNDEFSLSLQEDELIQDGTSNVNTGTEQETGSVDESTSQQLDEQYALSLLNDDDDDDDLIYSGLLGRIKTKPVLSISTLFMGILTAVIWTNDRFRYSITAGIGSSSNNNNNISNRHKPGGKKKKKKDNNIPRVYPAFPAETLLGISTHDTKDMVSSEQNSIEIDPPYSLDDLQYETELGTHTITYWKEVANAIEETQDDPENTVSLSNDTSTVIDVWSNITDWGPCFPRALPPPKGNSKRLLRFKDKKEPITMISRNWTFIVQSNSDHINDEDTIIYPKYRGTSFRNRKASVKESLEGLCRPGFLIIGQGKCGTSSLYHYLTGHPRILPAIEKQIHYFIYHKSKPLSWYYSHFPTIESFLGRGALISGEASPGYMPYPSVVETIVKRMSPNSKPSGGSVVGDANGVEAWKQTVRSLPKIIAIVRDPIDRALSSYKYNYIEPAIKKLKLGRGVTASGHRIPGGKTDQYYRQRYLFSFEELVFAELKMLKECLEYGGRGEQWTNKRFGTKPDQFFYEAIQRRNMNRSNMTDTTLDSPPLVNLDEACYMATKSQYVPRAQWTDLAKLHPNKSLALPNLQLVQSLVGRGVYSHPLEWWYEVFSHSDAIGIEDRIHVVCTEDMANTPETIMESITSFLGLPDFDFENVTDVGRYNVGGHRGYDTITKLHEEDDEDISMVESTDDEDRSNTKPEERMLLEEVVGEDETPNKVDNLLVISDALRNELQHFYRPYNERLFQLIRKRCPWKY